MDRDRKDGAPGWQLLVRVVGQELDFDVAVRDGGQLEASAHGRMERLLRETGVPAGLLCNGRALRLISAPRGESSGWIDFRVADMVQTAGRPIVAALRLLLPERRLLTLPRGERLMALLTDSRRFQNEVSTKLAEQVLHALYELLRGFQAAHDATDGELLREPLADDPDDVYACRAALMVKHDEGLTKTYNRFHDPYDRDLEIEQLRVLHTEMDQRRSARLRLGRQGRRREKCLPSGPSGCSDGGRRAPGRPGERNNTA